MMSFGDIFFPDNAVKRQRVIQLNQKLVELMSRNFDATNDLIDVLNEHCGTNIRKVKLVESDTVRQNCDAFTRKINEVQKEVKKIDERLERLLDPAIYKEIHNVDLSFQDVFQLVKKISTAALSVVTTVAVVAVVVSVSKGLILCGLVECIGMVGACAVAGIAVSVLMLGVGMILGLFTGLQERERLDEAIKDLERVLRDFEPASKEYTRKIYKVLAFVESS